MRSRKCCCRITGDGRRILTAMARRRFTFALTSALVSPFHSNQAVWPLVDDLYERHLFLAGVPRRGWRNRFINGRRARCKAMGFNSHACRLSNPIRHSKPNASVSTQTAFHLTSWQLLRSFAFRPKTGETRSSHQVFRLVLSAGVRFVSCLNCTENKSTVNGCGLDQLFFVRTINQHESPLSTAIKSGPRNLG